MLPLRIWKPELIGSTRAEAAQSSYHMKGANWVFSLITSEEEGDVSDLRTRKQWKPTASWPSMNKRTSFGSKYTIIMPNRPSQNSQRTITYPLAKVRREVVQEDNHLRRPIMWHLWIQMTIKSPTPGYSHSKLWPTDRKLSTKCWFIFTVTNSTKDSLICKNQSLLSLVSHDKGHWCCVYRR